MTDYLRTFKLNCSDVAIAYVLIYLLIGIKFLDHSLIWIGNIFGFVDSMVKAMVISDVLEIMGRIHALLVPTFQQQPLLLENHGIKS